MKNEMRKKTNLPADAAGSRRMARVRKAIHNTTKNRNDEEVEGDGGGQLEQMATVLRYTNRAASCYAQDKRHCSRKLRNPIPTEGPFQSLPRASTDLVLLRFQQRWKRGSIVFRAPE